MSDQTPQPAPFPFTYETGKQIHVVRKENDPTTETVTYPNVRGRFPSAQASRLRSMTLEAFHDKTKIVPLPCAYDGLSSRLVEEAGFPAFFLSGYSVAAGLGLPDTGYIAMQEMCDKIQESVRQVSIPIIVDGDTGYGSPLNVRRTVECFARAGAAGVMIEDQTWPKRCGHTKGKSVVSREEAFARIRAACDARDEGIDVFILARTDALVIGWDEAMYRAKEFMALGADGVFVEAVPDRDAMKRCVEELKMPLLVNIIEGGLTQNLRATELAEIGFSFVAYPFTLVAAQLKSIREALEALKASMSVGPPPMILSAQEVCRGVGFNKYWDLEKRYAYSTPAQEGEKPHVNGDSKE